MKSRHPADLLDLAERIIRHTEDAGDKNAVINTGLVGWLLDRAKVVKKLRGAPGLTGRQKIHEWLVVRQAVNRKEQLARAGMRREKAAEKAAAEAVDKLRKSGRPLSETTIMRKMQAAAARRPR